jgi:hypothetical protein
MPPTYRYKEVEHALVVALDIAPNDMGKFRAKLRHTRDDGVPSIQWSGTGAAAEYARRHVIELGVCLELQHLGQPPKASAATALSIVRTCDTSPGRDDDEHIFIAFTSASAAYTVLTGRAMYLDWFQSAPRSFMVLDLTATIAALDAALSHQDDPPE